jgi:hypothetical protein
MATAEDIAFRLGYRPARKAIPAATKMCRSINRRFPRDGGGAEAAAHNIGKYLSRLPPRDQWSNAKWCITSEGLAEIKAAK